ncbi:MAG: hypothetical protein M0P13_12185 [Fibrobacteraceae bacterium]|nr:hypothetical protein [Fibrobacteraceae bacterium]
MNFNQFSQKFKSFRKKMQDLSPFQKAVLLILIVAIPAGIALASILIFKWKSRDKE